MSFVQYLFLLFFELNFLNFTISHDYLYENENFIQLQEKKLKLKIDDISRGPCNIPIVTLPISQDDFIINYAYKSPVIFKKSAFQNERNKLFQEKCQIPNLVDTYGDKYVTISTANTYSYKKFSIKFSEYINKYVLVSRNQHEKLKYGNETWYFFGENNFTEWKDLIDLYERPHFNLPLHKHAYSFGIAASTTGNFKT
jgi:hypothetical protein